MNDMYISLADLNLTILDSWHADYVTAEGMATYLQPKWAIQDGSQLRPIYSYKLYITVGYVFIETLPYTDLYGTKADFVWLIFHNFYYRFHILCMNCDDIDNNSSCNQSQVTRLISNYRHYYHPSFGTKFISLGSVDCYYLYHKASFNNVDLFTAAP